MNWPDHKLSFEVCCSNILRILRTTKDNYMDHVLMDVVVQLGLCVVPSKHKFMGRDKTKHCVLW